MPLTTPALDRDITEWVADHRAAWLTDVFRVITTVGNTAAMTLIAVVAGVVLFRSGFRDRALSVVIGSASGWLLMQALKHLIARPRPEPRFRVLAIDTFSFPSGHAMMSAIVLGLVAVAARQSSAWVRAHPTILLIAPVASLLIGASRIYLGVHWTTDVVAGWVIGALWVLVVVALSRARVARTGRRGGSPDVA